MPTKISNGVNTIPREKCCVTNEPLEPLIAFPHCPIRMNCVDYPASEDLFSDMDFGISPKGVIQLRQLLPPDLLYSEVNASGGVGGKWQRHHKEFADFILQFTPKKVLEIGAGHGILSQYFEGKASWTIVDPNAGQTAPWVEMIKDFFDEDFPLAGRWDCIVHSHFFEHLYEPNKFLSKIFNESPKGTLNIFSLPNFDQWFKNFDLNTLNLQHTVLMTEDVIDYLLLTNGFKILQKHKFEDHSFFYATQTNEKVSARLANNYEARKGHFLKGFADIRALMGELNASKEPLFLYGAHIFSQFLLTLGLDEKLVINILDNDASKQGKRLYGSNLKVASPNVLKDYDQPKVLLKVGRYKDEISNQLLTINPKVRIIT